MPDRFDDLLLYDQLDPDVRRALWQDVADDEGDLAAALCRWRAVCERVRHAFAADLPPCRLLVAYALEQDDRRALLSADEQAALDAGRDDLEAARAAHPALDIVIARIQEERADFDAAWAEAGLDEAGLDDASVGEAAVETTRPSAARAGGTAAPRRAERPARRDRAPQPAAATRRAATARTLRTWAGVGLAVALLAAAVVLFWPQGGAAPTTFATADGETRVLDLPDGSSVRLLPASRLAFVPDADAFDRTATLERGRAFFDVAHDPAAPFVVTTPTAQTTVLGTQFGLRLTTGATGASGSGAPSDAAGHGPHTEVVLATGRVQVARPDGVAGVTLAPGEASAVAAGGAPTPPRPVDLAAALDWTGLFVFRATPAAAIAERLGAHYDVPVAVADVLARERVTGTFEQAQPLGDVLAALSATLGAEVEPRPDGEGFRLVPAR